jgi:hypothetical protein
MNRILATLTAGALLLSAAPAAGASPSADATASPSVPVASAPASPSADPAASPSLPSLNPSASASPAGWTASALTQPGDTWAPVVGVAAGPSSLVAVGKTVCEPPRRKDIARCWGQPWTSSDGMTWTAVDARTAGIDLGFFRPTTGGPEIGLAGVAYGPGGFVAFGRAQATPKGPQRSALWRSADGTTWQRVKTADAFPAASRLRTILGTTDGYLLGGVIYDKRAPHAAVWSSPDGVTWTLGRGREAWDIGGYIDTLEDPASGGVDAFAVYPAPADGTGSTAGGAVAVGEACMGPIDRSIWSFNGQCWGQLWRSPDGAAWRKGDLPQTFGTATAVATSGDRIVVGAPICWDCPPAMLVSDDLTTWRVGYGSPVDGRLVAMTSAGGRFYALLVVTDVANGQRTGESLALWSSDDGTQWRLDETQPSLPVAVTSFHEVAMAVAGDRLVVTAAAETEAAPGFASVALLGPVLP